MVATHATNALATIPRAATSTPTPLARTRTGGLSPVATPHTPLPMSLANYIPPANIWLLRSAQ